MNFSGRKSHGGNEYNYRVSFYLQGKKRGTPPGDRRQIRESIGGLPVGRYFLFFMLLLAMVFTPVTPLQAEEYFYDYDNGDMEWLYEGGSIEIEAGIPFQTALARGRVVEVLAEEEVMDVITNEPVVDQLLKVRLLSGDFKGKEIIVQNYGMHSPVYGIHVKKGDGVIIALQTEEGEIKEAYLADYLREPPIYVLSGLFVLALLAIGRRRGIKAFCSLLFTMALIWLVLLPGFLRGYNPILLTICISAVATMVTLFIVGGLTYKSLAAVLGTIGGVLIAGLTALLVGKAAHLTGFGTEEAAMLLYIPQDVSLDIQGLLFAGIIIGALGAVMDVSISVASAVEEVKKANPALSTSALIESGMNVGRDIMGTMSNTLILAYTGSSVPLLLIFMAYQESLVKMLNLDMIATEIVRALAGSLGMILVVPFIAVIAGLFFGGKAKKDGNMK